MIVNLYRKSFGGLSRHVWLLSVVTFINRAGTMVIPFLSVYLSQELGFSLQETGLIMAIFGAGSVIGTIGGGKLSDKYGYYPVLFWSLLITGIIFILLKFMVTFWSVAATIFVLSVIGDAFRPAINSSVGAYSTAENRTRSISLLRLAVNLGFSIGPAIGGFLAYRFGYDLLFLADGFTCIGAAIFFRLSLTREPRTTTPVAPPESHTGTPTYSSPYRDKTFLFFSLMITCWAVAFMQLFSVIPVFLKSSLMLNEGQIGALLAFNGLLIALFEMPVVYSIEGRIKHLDLIRWGAVAVAIAFLVYIIPAHWLFISVLSFFIITVGEVLTMPFSSSYALNRSTDDNRGQYMAVYSLAYSIGHIIAPIIGLNIAAQYGYNILWLIVAGLSMIAFAGLTLMTRPGFDSFLTKSKTIV
jgi:predicted MFS family arabinose efflux permease